MVVYGVYHHVSRGHLDRYCDEFAFRYENRKVSDAERANRLVMGAEGKRLTYNNQLQLSKAFKEKWRKNRKPTQLKLGL